MPTPISIRRLRKIPARYRAVRKWRAHQEHLAKAKATRRAKNKVARASRKANR